MATNTMYTFLMISDDGSKYRKLVDITEYPDLMGEPETLETTTLSDSMATNILGLQSSDMLAFPCWYSLDKYTELKALEGTEHHLAIWFGGTDGDTPTGSEGKFAFDGYISTRVTGAGVNEVKGMEVDVSASTPVEVTSNGTLASSPVGG